MNFKFMLSYPVKKREKIKGSILFSGQSGCIILLIVSRRLEYPCTTLQLVELKPRGTALVSCRMLSNDDRRRVLLLGKVCVQKTTIVPAVNSQWFTSVILWGMAPYFEVHLQFLLLLR